MKSILAVIFALAIALVVLAAMAVAGMMMSVTVLNLVGYPLTVSWSDRELSDAAENLPGFVLFLVMAGLIGFMWGRRPYWGLKAKATQEIDDAPRSHKGPHHLTKAIS